MIPNEELHFKFLDYVIKNHKPNIATDPVIVLEELGLNEHITYANDIAKELEKEGFLEILTDGIGKVIIENYTSKAKYFIEEIRSLKDKISESQISKNDVTVINQIIIGDYNQQIIN